MDEDMWSRELQALSRKASRRGRVASQVREVGSRADALDRRLAERSAPKATPRRGALRRRRGLWLALGLQGPMLLGLLLVARLGAERSAVAAVMPAQAPPPQAQVAAPAESPVPEARETVQPTPAPPAEEDPPPPELEVPGAVLVASLPFVQRGDTSTSAERRIDAYGCAPTKPEHGAEVWYRLTLAEPGRILASIREDKHDGVDVDLHLLTSVDPSSCIARDNERIDTPVDAGTYWLVLDTFGDRLQKPGPYQLDVRVEPAR